MGEHVSQKFAGFNQVPECTATTESCGQKFSLQAPMGASAFVNIREQQQRMKELFHFGEQQFFSNITKMYSR